MEAGFKRNTRKRPLLFFHLYYFAAISSRAAKILGALRHARNLLAGIQARDKMDSRQKIAGMTDGYLLGCGLQPAIGHLWTLFDSSTLILAVFTAPSYCLHL